MKISEVTIIEIKQFCRIDFDDDDVMLMKFWDSAQSYVRSYTGLSDTEMEENEDITIAVLVVLSDMYDNRSYSSKENSGNKIAKGIMDLHSQNLM